MGANSGWTSRGNLLLHRILGSLSLQEINTYGWKMGTFRGGDSTGVCGEALFGAESGGC